MVSEKIFNVFPIISEWEIMIYPVCGLFGPRGMIGRIYKGEH